MTDEEKAEAVRQAAKIAAVAALTASTGGAGAAAAPAAMGTAGAGAAAGAGAGAAAGAGVGTAGAGAGGLIDAAGADAAESAAAETAPSIARRTSSSAGGEAGWGTSGDGLGKTQDGVSAAGDDSGDEDREPGADPSGDGDKDDGDKDDGDGTVDAPEPDDGHGTLGQGGTSMVDAVAQGADAAGGKGKAGRVAEVAAAGAATAAAGPVMSIMMLLLFLKTMIMAAVQAVAGAFGWLLSAASMVWNFTTGVIGAVGGFFAGVGAAFGSTIGVSASTGMAMVVAAVVAAAAAVGGIAASDVAAQTAAQNSVAAASCTQGQTELAAAQSADPTQVGAAQLQTAQTVYSVLAAWGMPDANIAGILGNWQAESGLDPTSVQNDFSAPYQMTGAKQILAQDTVNGIGLGQWTFGRNASLRAFAKAAGEDWWTVKAQLAYAVSPAEGANADVIKIMMSTPEGGPGQAALYFQSAWERSADNSTQVQRRATYAEKWFALMSGWSANTTLADSILAQAGTTLTAADQAQAASAKASCQSMDTSSVFLTPGGMTVSQAQQLVALYNQDGNAFLDGRYGQYGGPGSCGDNHAENCVSFSVYFLNKYTTFQEYPPGNGIETARAVARMTGKKLSSVPTPYSIGSGPGSGPAGHTLVVLGIQGNDAIIGEAAYCQFMGRVRVVSVASLQAAGWVFVPMADAMLPPGQEKQS